MNSQNAALDQSPVIRYWRAVVVVLFLAMGFALLSLHTHVAVHKQIDFGYVASCDISATINCSKVELSPWSRFMGLPLAALGFGFYLGLWAFGLLAGSAAGLSLVGVLSYGLVLLSVTLFIIAKFWVGSLCLWCLGTYVCNLLLMFVSQLRAGSMLELLRSDLRLLGNAFRVTKITIWGGAVCIGLTGVLASMLLMDGLVSGDSRRARVRELAKAVSVDSFLASATVSLELDLEGELLTRDFSLGSTQAPIEVVEFADFQCPACQQSYAQIRQLVAKFSPHVRFVLKNYPLDNSCNATMQHRGHVFSCEAAQLARCAGEQGKFFSVADNLMQGRLSPVEETTSYWDFVAERIPTTPKLQDLDSAKLRDCFESGRQLGKIQRDIQLGTALDIKGTPTLYLNGRLLEHTSEPELSSLIEALIDRLGAK